MGRRINAWLGVVLLVGSISQPATAKDRKSAAPDDRAIVSSAFPAGEVQARAARADASGGFADRAAATATLNRSAANRNGSPTAPLQEQHNARSNALSLKLGALTVKPAVGGIKGAQFSIGF